jgi:hypothetical protein
MAASESPVTLGLLISSWNFVSAASLSRPSRCLCPSLVTHRSPICDYHHGFGLLAMTEPSGYDFGRETNREHSVKEFGDGKPPKTLKDT